MSTKSYSVEPYSIPPKIDKYSASYEVQFNPFGKNPLKVIVELEGNYAKRKRTVSDIKKTLKCQHDFAKLCQKQDIKLIPVKIEITDYNATVSYEVKDTVMPEKRELAAKTIRFTSIMDRPFWIIVDPVSIFVESYIPIMQIEHRALVQIIKGEVYFSVADMKYAKQLLEAILKAESPILHPRNIDVSDEDRKKDAERKEKERLKKKQEEKERYE